MTIKEIVIRDRTEGGREEGREGEQGKQKQGQFFDSGFPFI